MSNEGNDAATTWTTRLSGVSVKRSSQSTRVESEATVVAHGSGT